jgi:hypothetical protein
VFYFSDRRCTEPQTLNGIKVFWNETLLASVLSCIRDTCPAPLILINFMNWIVFGEEPSSCSYHYPVSSSYHYPVSSSPFWAQTPSSVIILSLCTWFNEKDDTSHAYKTWGKFTFLYILIFIFLDTTVLEKKKFVPMESGATWVQCSLNSFMNNCRFVRVVPKYLTFAILFKNVLAIFLF